MQAHTALMASLFALALAIGHAMRDRRTRLNKHFVLLGAVLGVWYATTFISTISTADLWLRLKLISALAIPLAAQRFYLELLSRSGPVTSKSPKGTMVAGMLLLLLVFTPYARQAVIHVMVASYVFVVLTFCVLSINERRRWVESRLERTRLQYLTIGTMATVALNLVDLWLQLGLGNVMTTLFLFFLSQALIKHRLLDLNEFLGKCVVLSLVGVALALIYTLLVIWVGTNPLLMLFNTLVATIVIMILFEPLRTFAETRLNPILFRRRYEFERRLEELRTELANVIDVDEMGKLIMRRLDESRRVSSASLYLMDEAGTQMKVAAWVGSKPKPAVQLGQLVPLLSRLSRERVLLREGLERQREEAQELGGVVGVGELGTVEEVLELLDLLQCDVTLPLVGGGRIWGLLNLKDDRLREAYSLDELSRLTGVAAQAAITVENSRIYRTLRERDRLAALGEMAAGLAHEIRNPLGAIKGAAQYISTGTDGNQDPNEEFLCIIIEEVNRLNRVLTQFLDYSRPVRGRNDSVDVNEVLQKTAAVLRGSERAGDSTLTLELEEPLPPVGGAAESLHQVFLNLGLNALEAVRGGGDLTIRSKLQRADAHDERRVWSSPHETLVEVAFADNGPGIPAAHLENIFIPFFTTKESGSGLGLSICERIVKGMSGELLVNTEDGAGTCFTVRLPVSKPAPAGGKETE